MSAITLSVCANCDMATIAWSTSQPIAECRGFALERDVAGSAGLAKNGFVDTWVGFVGQKHTSGESQPSTVWPIQRYIWSDYVVGFGQKVRYRVIPMIGPAASLKKAPQAQWSAWSTWVTIGTGQTPGFSAYFNRGVVASQFLARQADTQQQFTKMLQGDINKSGNKLREFLSGTLRVELLRMLADAKTVGTDIYAALYELNDPDILTALKAIGARCHLILGSGAYTAADKKKGTKAIPDENASVRSDLKAKSKIDVIDRLVKSPHFAHNKFIVFCDGNGVAKTLWTGSTNLTVTGMCTQTNNGILIEDATIAAAYLKRWQALKSAGAGYPDSLAIQGSTVATHSLNKSGIRAWNVPCQKYVDLKDAKGYIAAAKEGVLFLMFNPGTGDGVKREKALIQDILALDTSKLLVQGVLNQDPGGKKAPLIQLTHKGQQLKKVPLPAILPKGIKRAGQGWFKSTFTYNMVMIHSKVIVIDPFGDHPVLMTGSHNMGPKASASNDDNLVIIENAGGLAGEYATYIMNIYGHYKWMFNEYLTTQGATAADKKQSPQYDGNADDDAWQKRYLTGVNRREIDFWLASQP